MLSGSITTDHDESWASLDEALNDLGQLGYQITTPIYGPGSKAGEQVAEALILTSNATAADDLKRQTGHCERLLQAARTEAANSRTEMSRKLADMEVHKLSDELEALRRRQGRGLIHGGTEPPPNLALRPTRPARGPALPRLVLCRCT